MISYMTRNEYDEARSCWIDERVAIMTVEGMEEQEAIRYAGELWERYRRANRIYRQEQGGL